MFHNCSHLVEGIKFLGNCNNIEVGKERQRDRVRQKGRGIEGQGDKRE